MKYIGLYRCLHCDALIAVGPEVEGTPEQAAAAVSMLIEDPKCATNPFMSTMRLHALHNCTDTIVGLAQFVGYRPLDSIANSPTTSRTESESVNTVTEECYQEIHS